MLDPVLHNRGELILSAADCENFRDFVDREAEVEGIALETLYHQGYLDCVKLLQPLGDTR